jgi:hypothetical protein
VRNFDCDLYFHPQLAQLVENRHDLRLALNAATTSDEMDALLELHRENERRITDWLREIIPVCRA